MAARRLLERLRPDQHADVKQDRQDRDHGNQAADQRGDAEPGEHQHHYAGRGGIADAAAHRFPAGMADIDGVDEGIAEQTTNEADHAVRRQHLRRRERIARRRRALDVIHRFDEIVDAERNRRDEDHAQIFETGEHVADGGQRNRKAEMRQGVADRAAGKTAVAEAENVGAPRDHRSHARSRPGRPARPEVAHAAEPVGEDHRETDDADQRRIKHQRPGRIEMKVIEMPASEPSKAARGVIRRMTGAMKPPPSARNSARTPR